MNVLRAFIILLTAALPLQAQEDSYDSLMTALAQTQTRAEAEVLAAEIWQIWLTAPDAVAQEVLDAAMERRRAYDFAGAIKELDRLIEFYPDYAEAWNQRATMYFLIGEFDASLADVAQVLTLEPRHFGALAGKGVILFQQGKLPLAQLAVREGLRHHPFLNERAILEASPGTDL